MKKEELKKLLAERESLMFGYYRSVFEEGFGGGYPANYDEPILNLLDQEMAKAREKITTYLAKYPDATLADYYADNFITPNK